MELAPNAFIAVCDVDFPTGILKIPGLTSGGIWNEAIKLQFVYKVEGNRIIQFIERRYIMKSFAVNGKYWIGIDLSKDTFDVSIAPLNWEPERWRELPVKHIDSSPVSEDGIACMIKWVKGYAALNLCEGVCVESTGKLSHRFSEAISNNCLPTVSIINPRRSKAFGVSLGIEEKTDDVDAAVLALFGALRNPKPAISRSDSEKNLQELNRLREGLVKSITEWKNRLKDVDLPFSKKTILNTIKGLKEKIKEIEKESERIINSDASLKEQVKWIQKVKGLGKVNAVTITAEFGRLDKYKRNELIAKSGLNPKRYQSGKTVYKPPRLSKGGGGRVRRTLYMGCMSLFKSDNPLRDIFVERLIANGKNSMSAMGAMMRKLLLIARAVVKSGGVYDKTKISREYADC